MQHLMPNLPRRELFNLAAGRVRVWFQDRYEWHLVIRESTIACRVM
jgi:hypothetical protein